MADYGLRVFNASGNIKLDVVDKITRFRYGAEVASGASGSVTLSDIDGLSSVEFSVGIEDENFSECPHLVSRLGTKISWTAQSGDQYTSAASLVFVFLYT